MHWIVASNSSPKLTKSIMFLSYFMNEEAKTYKSQGTDDVLQLGNLNLDLFVSIVNQGIFVSKLLLLISHDSTSSSHAVALHLSHISVPMTYLCNQVILLHLRHTLHLCHISATMLYLSLCHILPCFHAIPLPICHILYPCHTLHLCHISYPCSTLHICYTRASVLYLCTMLYPFLCCILHLYHTPTSMLYLGTYALPISVP